jgi:hypothetical protein
MFPWTPALDWFLWNIADPFFDSIRPMWNMWFGIN